MKSFLELAEERYSVRAFKQDAVEDEKIAAILRAAQLAPTACNYRIKSRLTIRSFICNQSVSRDDLV